MNILLRTGFFGVLLLFAFSTMVWAQIPSDSLKLHLKADAGIATDENGNVSGWTDQSGNTNNAQLPGETARPEFVASSINGEPALRFNGTNTFLSIPNASDLGISDNDYQIFIVAKTASANTSINFLLSSAGTGEQYEVHTNGSAGVRYIPNTGTYIDEGALGDYSDGNAQLFQVEATSSYGLVRMNGINTAQTNTNGRSSDTNNLQVGTRGGGGYWFDGDIAEVIIYNSVLSDSARGLVENYLGNKYGIDVPEITPTVQVSNLTTSNPTSTSIQLGFTEGNGNQRLIIAKSGSAVDFEPVDGNSYTANAEFGSSAELGAGNHVVYAGTGNSVTVTGLNPDNTYHFYAIEYNGTAGNEKYLRTNPERIEVSIPSTIMTFNSSASEPGFTFVNWGYDSGTGRAYHNTPSAPATITANSGTFDVIGFDVFEFTGGQTFEVESDLGDTKTFTDTGNKTVTLNWEGVTSLTFTRITGNGAGFEMDNVVYDIKTPSVQVSNLTYSNLTSTSVQLDLTAGDGDNRLIIAKSGSAVDFEPIDGNSYTANTEFGASTELGVGNYAVYAGDGNSVTVTGLNPENSYHFYAVEYNGGSGNEQYLQTNPERLDITTPTETPTVQVSNLTASNLTNASVKLNFTPGNGNKTLIIAKKGSAVDFEPLDGTSYAANAEFGTSTELGNGNYAVYAGFADTARITGLTPNNSYHFYAVEFNGESGGEAYLRTNPVRIDVAINTLPLQNLKIHFKADSGVVTDVSGNVSSWLDLSGNGNNAVQTSSINRPSVTSNSINGEPAIRFNGGNNFLSLPKAIDLGITSNDYQIFIVAKSATPTTGIYFLTSTQNAGSQFEIHTNGGQGVRFIPSGTTYIDEGNTGDYTDGNAHVFQIEATSTYGLVRMDGNTSAQSSGDLRSSEDSELLLGTRSGGQYWFNGDIAEVIIYNAVLGESNRQSVEEYLKVKYDIDQPLVQPTVATSNISASEVTSNSMKISLTPGDGDGRLIVASTDTILANPADQVTYSANSNFGSGNVIGGDNFVVYNGAGSEVTVTGLNPTSTYYFAAFEYNSNPLGIDYLTTSNDTLSQKTTIAPPEILSTTFKNNSDGAVFSAQVKSYATTEYRIYWGIDKASYSDSTSIFPDISATTITHQVSELNANTAYFAEVRAITPSQTVSSDPQVLYFQNSTIPTDSLSVWLAADQVFSDLQDNDKISVWYDLSGKQNNATQSNSSYQAEFTANHINGLPAVNFNGSSYLNLPNSEELGIVNEDYEIILVAGFSANGTYHLIGNEFNSSSTPNLYFSPELGLRFKGNYSNSEITSGDPVLYTDGGYHVFNATGTNTEGRIRINNILKADNESESYWNNVNGNWKLGASVNPGTGSVASYLNGKIAEIIIYNKELAAQERHKLHVYLSEKYALNLSLDTPTEQVSSLNFERSGGVSAELSFSSGNGAYNLAVIKAGSAVDESPIDSTEYLASGEFGSGSEIGSGNFVVYAGTDTSVTINGLSQGETYFAKVFSFNGEGGYQKYLTTGADTASLFLPQIIAVSALGPAPFSNSIARNTDIEVTFSGAMNAASFNTDSSFVVRGSISGTHTGTFALTEGDTKASFSSNKSFMAGETVTVTIGKNLEGAEYRFEDPRTYSFTISASPSLAAFKKITDLTGFGSAAAKVTTANSAIAGGNGLLSLGDMNGDGLPDIVVSDFENGLSIYINNGDSTYSSPTDLNLNDSIEEIILSDFDTDGDLDIAMPGYSQLIDSTIIRIIRNNGDGTYNTSEEYNTNYSIYVLRSSDLDNDGDIDLVIFDSGGIIVYKNNGSSFTPGNYYNTDDENSNGDLIISDLNGDGYGDLIISEEYNNTIYWLENDKEAGFSTKHNLTTIDEPKQISIADIDNDGNGDLISGTTDDTYLSVFLGSGDGTFASAQTYGIADYPLEIHPFDADGDGDLDVFSVHGSDYSVLVNDGNGTFPKEYSSNAGNSITGWQLADMDNNGTVDFVIVTNYGIEVYSNTKIEPLKITGAEGWRLYASPVGTVPFSTMLSGLWTQGFTGASTEEGVSNVYVWPKDSSGSSNTSWTSISNIADSLESGRGMLAYIYSDDNYDEPGNAGFPKEIEFLGTEPTETVYLYSDDLNVNENGWTLLGNPFYKQIDWDGGNFSYDEITNSVYVYDADSAQWKSWNGTSGSLTNGIIDIYDAFFIQSTGNGPNLSILYPSENGDGVAKEVANKKEVSVFSLEITSDSGFSNKAWFQFSDEAASGIDTYDAHKLTPLSSNYTLLGSKLDDETLLDINNLPYSNEVITVPLYFESTESGQHQISLNRVMISEEWHVSLKDHQTGEIVDVDEPYEFSHQAAKRKRAKLKPASLVNPQLKAKAGSTNRFTLFIKPAADQNGGLGIPEEFGLDQNYPNPFNPSTTIKYQLPEGSKVELRVFDVLGREVATLINENLKAGFHQITFNAGHLASGLYLYRLKAGKTVITKKLTLIK